MYIKIQLLLDYALVSVKCIECHKNKMYDYSTFLYELQVNTDRNIYIVADKKDENLIYLLRTGVIWFIKIYNIISGVKDFFFLGLLGRLP